MHTPCDLDVREGAHSTVILAAWEMFILMALGWGWGLGTCFIGYECLANKFGRRNQPALYFIIVDIYT